MCQFPRPSTCPTAYLRHNDRLVRVVDIYNAAQLELAKHFLKNRVLTVQYRLNIDVVFFSEIYYLLVNLHINAVRRRIGLSSLGM